MTDIPRDLSVWLSWNGNSQEGRNNQFLLRYSVISASREYQSNECKVISLFFIFLKKRLQMFSRIAVPFGSSIVPQFIFWPTYSLMTYESEHAYMKYFSVALYDAWFAMLVILLSRWKNTVVFRIAIISIVSVPLCQPQIARHMPPKLRFTFFAEQKLV